MLPSTTAPGATVPSTTRVASPSGAARRALGASRGELAWLMWPPLIFFALALGLPMLMLVLQSFETGGAAYVDMWTVPAFVSSIGRTLALSVVTMILTMLIGTLYSLGIVAAPTWLKYTLLAGLMLSLWTSVMVRSFGWMLMELPKGAIFWFLQLVGISDRPVELYQTALGMYPAMIAVMLPFAVLPTMSALQGLDHEQLSAARIFGAGPVLTFRTVTLPTVAPSMISGGILVFVMALGFYVTPLLLGGPSNMTVSVVIDAQMNQANRPEIGAAMSLLLVVGTMLVYLLADRLFRVSERWG